MSTTVKITREAMDAELIQRAKETGGGIAVERRPGHSCWHASNGERIWLGETEFEAFGRARGDWAEREDAYLDLAQAYEDLSSPLYAVEPRRSSQNGLILSIRTLLGLMEEELPNREYTP